jgi:hypothetical protein
MPLVVTDASSIVCAHKGHAKLTASQTKLKVAGANVLVAGDIKGSQIPDCTTVPDTNTSTAPCLAVSSEQGGVASKLMVGGKGVVLKTITGQTNGTVSGTPQTWSVQDAGQTKLQAS